MWLDLLEQNTIKYVIHDNEVYVVHFNKSIS